MQAMSYITDPEYRIEVDAELRRQFVITEGLIELAEMPKKMKLSPDELMTNRYTMESIYGEVVYAHQVPALEGFNPITMVINAIKSLFKFIANIATMSWRGLKAAYQFILRCLGIGINTATGIDKLHEKLKHVKTMEYLRGGINSKTMSQIVSKTIVMGFKGNGLSKLIDDIDNIGDVAETFRNIQSGKVVINVDLVEKVMKGDANDEEKLGVAVILAISHLLADNFKEYSFLTKHTQPFDGVDVKDVPEIDLHLILEIGGNTNPSPVNKLDLEEFNIAPFIHSGIYQNGIHGERVDDMYGGAIGSSYLSKIRSTYKSNIEKSNILSTYVGTHGAIALTATEPNANGQIETFRGMIFGNQIYNEAGYQQAKQKYGSVVVYPSIDLRKIEDIPTALRIVGSDDLKKRLEMYQDDIKTIADFTGSFNVEEYLKNNPEKSPVEILEFLKVVDSWRWFITNYYEFQTNFIQQFVNLGNKSLTVYKMIFEILSGDTKLLYNILTKMEN